MSVETGFELRETERYATGVRFSDGCLSLRPSFHRFGGLFWIAVSIALAVVGVRFAFMDGSGSAEATIVVGVLSALPAALGVWHFRAGVDATTTAVVVRTLVRTWRFGCDDVAEVRLGSKLVRGYEAWFPIVELTGGAIIPLHGFGSLKGPTLFTLRAANLARLRAEVLQRFFIAATCEVSDPEGRADSGAIGRLSRTIEDPPRPGWWSS